MGRFIDFVALIAALMAILVVQTSGAVMLDPLRDEILEDNDIGAEYNAQSNFDQMFTAVTKWVPTIASFGVIIIVAWREYRRQRITAVRGPRI